MLTSYAHLLLSRPSIPNIKVFPSRLLALHLFIFRVSESHLLSTSSLPSCLPSVTCSLSPQFSADSAHTIRQLSGRQIWRIILVPFFFFFFFLLLWLAPCGVGFDTIPSLPASPFDVRHRADSPQREIPVIATIRDRSWGTTWLRGMLESCITIFSFKAFFFSLCECDT